LTVTDANGCQNFAAVTINEPAELTASSVATDENCQVASGAIDLSVTGGTAPFSFNWSNDATTEDLDNLEAGIYSVGVME